MIQLRAVVQRFTNNGYTKIVFYICVLWYTDWYGAVCVKFAVEFSCTRGGIVNFEFFIKIIVYSTQLPLMLIMESCMDTQFAQIDAKFRGNVFRCQLRLHLINACSENYFGTVFLIFFFLVFDVFAYC